MTENSHLKIHNNIINNSPETIHRFSHKAMATIFEIFIIHEDSRYAGQAAHSAFCEVDRLEQELSRFIENSDISRINRFGAVKSVSLGLDTFECLEQCAELHKKTGGAFDITVGPLLKCWLNSDKTLRFPSEEEIAYSHKHIGMNLVRLNKKQHAVKLKINDMCLDLGAFGKGYAVDKAAEVLNEWDIATAVIHGGMSSVLALNAPPGEKGWHVTVSNPKDYQQDISHFYLQNRAVSGSGLRKGQHIINPKTAQPVTERIAAWAVTPTAAIGDAYSTAFMIMPLDEIRDFCLNNPDIQAIIVNEGTEGKSEIVHIGELGYFE